MGKRIGIIGGGAAGFFAAIQVARSYTNASVYILEGSKRLLTKVRISGGGRCNVTHNKRDVRELLQAYPRGGKELHGPFTRFAVSDTIEWFQKEGVALKVEQDNRMFPITDSSETIARCLIEAAKQAGVTIVKERKVISINKIDEAYCLTYNGQESETYDSVILTTGGVKSSFSLAEDLGHTIVPPVPSLFTFKIADPLLTDLEGISFSEVQATLEVSSKKFTKVAPLLITHWGLSAPAVIELSAWGARELHEANYRAKLTVSFLPRLGAQGCMEELNEAKKRYPKKQVSTYALFGLPKRFWTRAAHISGIAQNEKYADCSKEKIHNLASLLTQKEFQVTGKGVFKEEFVTSGGVKLSEVDFKTMQSKLTPGLYFAGEVLDIDGITGGFNFQSAWTTAWIAGSNCRQ